MTLHRNTLEQVRGSAVITVAILTLVTACNTCPKSSGVPTELVMREGARIDVNTKEGQLAIVAGSQSQRRYEWAGCGLTAHPCPRVKRWYGSLGIYDPAPGISYMFHYCHGVSRPVVEEGQIHFDNQAAAEGWLSRFPEMFNGDAVWTNDGLVVGWDLTPARSQLNVDVWQVCVRGKKPTSLAGATDEVFHVEPGVHETTAREDCAHVSADVIAETERVWAKHWQENDEFHALMKANPQTTQ